MSYLIRVLLPDEPGSLGELARSLGRSGANINSVDVVETLPDGTVMDDIVVTVPKDVMADVIVSAAQDAEGVLVDSIRPFAGRVDRRGQIQMLAQVAAKSGSVEDRLSELVGVMPSAVTSSWAVVLHTSDEGLTRAAASPAAPEDDGSTPQMPPVETARILQPDFDDWAPESWFQLGTSLTITPLHGTDMVLVVGRVGGPEFLASEVREIGDLGCITGAMLR